MIQKKFRNGITCIIARPEKCNKNYLIITLALRVGADDDTIVKGMAHFLEHVLLSFDRFGECNSNYCAIQGVTTKYSTLFKIKIEASEMRLKESLMIFYKILSGDYLNPVYFEYIKDDVLCEFNALRFEERIRYKILEGQRGCNLPIGIKKDIENIQFNDVIQFFSKYYDTREVLVCVVGSIRNIQNAYTFCEKIFGTMKRNYKFMGQVFSKIEDKKDWLFEKSTKNIEYYIKRKRLPSDLRERCLEDVCFIILENSFLIDKKDLVCIKCENIIYTYFSYYIKIDIETNDALRLDINDVRKILQSSLDYGINTDLTALIELYTNYLKEHFRINIDDYTDDLLDYFFFNIPFFSLDEYIMELKNLTKRDLFEMAKNLFYL